MKSKAINRRFSKLAIGLLASAMAFTSFMAPGMLKANAGVLDAAQDMYVSDYDSYMDTIKASSELNIEIAGEGFVLMKNQNNALPLASGEKNVTVLSAFMEYGGGGSGAQGVPTNATIAAENDWIGETEKTVYEGLEYNEDTLNSYLEEFGYTEDELDAMASEDEKQTAVVWYLAGQAIVDNGTVTYVDSTESEEAGALAETEAEEATDDENAAESEASAESEAEEAEAEIESVVAEETEAE